MSHEESSQSDCAILHSHPLSPPTTDSKLARSTVTLPWEPTQLSGMTQPAARTAMAGEDVCLLPVCSSSSSSAAAASKTTLSDSNPTFFRTFLATADLLLHTFTFLSFSDLLTASAISQLIHAAVDSDKVWRPRLTAALAISAVPTTTATTTSGTSSSVPRPPAASGHPSSPPSILTALSAVQRFCDGLILNQPMMRVGGRFVQRRAPVVNVIVPAERPLVYHVKYSIDNAPGPSHVEYLEMEIRQWGVQWDGDGEEEQQRDESKYSEENWAVDRVGPPLSGRLVLNMADNCHLLTAPTPPPNKQQSAKQRYLATFGCSVRHSAGGSTVSSGVCRTLLPAQPPLPAPTVPPRWFSEHLRDAVVRGEEPPPVPTSPFPPLAVWPVCRSCRAQAAAAVQAKFDQSRRILGFPIQMRMQVDCVVRVNESEWDARSREYEDEMEYRRVVLTTTAQPLTASTGTPTESPSSCTASCKPHFQATRLYQDESGVYAISHPSNLPFNNPAPPSGPPRTHPHHEHPLRYYRVSPYRHSGYVCNECAVNAKGEVWHCDKCQFDLCMECAAEWPVPGQEGQEEQEGQEGQEAEEVAAEMDADSEADGIEEEEEVEEDEYAQHDMSDDDETYDTAKASA